MTKRANVSSLFEQLGGEPVLRRVIDRFVERIFADPMIGFFFTKADKERIKAKEYEFAAAHLGASVVYSGKPLAAAHRSHPIMGGHFQRRLEILRQTLREAGAPPAVVAHWISHTERLRSSITKHDANDCRHDVPAGDAPVDDSSSSALPGHPPRVSNRRELPLVVGDVASTPSRGAHPLADEKGKPQ